MSVKPSQVVKKTAASGPAGKAEGSASKSKLLIALREEVLQLKTQLQEEKEERESITNWINNTLKPQLKTQISGLRSEVEAQNNQIIAIKKYLKETKLNQSGEGGDFASIQAALNVEREARQQLSLWIKQTLGKNLELLDGRIDERLSLSSGSILPVPEKDKNVKKSVVNVLPDSVGDWLRLIGYERYLGEFQKAKVTEIEQVTRLTDESLTKMGISLKRHREDLVHEIRALKDKLNELKDTEESVIASQPSAITYIKTRPKSQTPSYPDDDAIAEQVRHQLLEEERIKAQQHLENAKRMVEEEKKKLALEKQLLASEREKIRKEFELERQRDEEERLLLKKRAEQLEKEREQEKIDLARKLETEKEIQRLQRERELLEERQRELARETERQKEIQKEAAKLVAVEKIVSAPAPEPVAVVVQQKEPEKVVEKVEKPKEEPKKVVTESKTVAKSTTLTQSSDPNAPKAEKPFNEYIGDVRDDNCPTNWVLFHFDKETNAIHFSGCGKGGHTELCENLQPNKVQYALLRVVDKQRRIKFIYIHWVGNKAHAFLKARSGTKKAEVLKLIGQFHIEINAESLDDISPSIILTKLQAAVNF